MLTPEYMLHATEPAEEIAEALHQNILDRIIQRILHRFSRGDNYVLTAVDKWQLETVQEAGFLLEDVQKELSKATGLMQSEIAETMEDAGVRTLEYDDAIYRAAGLNPVPLMQAPYLIRLMQRNYEATLGEWENFTRTTATAAQQTFIRTCDNAYHMAATGTISTRQAVREAVEELAESGLEIIYYDKDGKVTRKDTIETATARAVRTGISQASVNITLARIREMKWDIILVSSHLGARINDKQDYTNHHWWQGKFYSDSGNDPRFPPFSVCGFGDVQGIGGANCRHHIGPGDGENNPFDHYDAEENRKQYEIDQHAREMERRIRRTKKTVMSLKTSMDNAMDEEQREGFRKTYERKAALLQKQNAAYNQYCKDHGLKKRDDRIHVAKWNRSHAARARAAAKRYNEEKE